MTSIAIVGLYCAACIGYGIGLCNLLGNVQRIFLGQSPSTQGILEQWTGHFLLGLITVSAALTCLGLVGLLQPTWIIAILLIGWLLGAQTAYAQISMPRFPGVGLLTQGAFWPVCLAVFLSVLVLGHGLSALLLPPKGDAEAFYMAYAKVLAATGRLEPMPGAFAFFSTIGLPGELHYTALMVLSAGQAAAAKFISWPVALSCCVFLVGIVRQCGGGMIARLLAVAVLLSSSTFTHHISDGKVDLFAAAFGLAAIYWALMATLHRKDRLSLFLTGFFCGAATMAKFSYLPTLGPAVMLLLIWRTFDASEWKSLDHWVDTAKDAALVVLAAAIPWLPQLLKNSVLFAAPLAPFIGGPQETDWINQVWFSSEVTGWILSTYPFALVFGRYPMQGGGLSLVMLAFAPFIFLALTRKDWQEGLLLRVSLAALLATIIWMIFRPSVIAPRYMLATLLLFVPFIVIATERILISQSTGWLLKTGTWGTLMVALAASVWHLLPVTSVIAQRLSGSADPCVAASSYCDATRLIISDGKPGERVMLAGYYNYWLRSDQIQCRDQPVEMKQLRAANDASKFLTDKGYRYVFVDSSSHPWVAQRLNEVEEKTAIYSANGLSVFELPQSVSAQTICIQTVPGQWQLVLQGNTGS